MVDSRNNKSCHQPSCVASAHAAVASRQIVAIIFPGVAACGAHLLHPLRVAVAGDDVVEARRSKLLYQVTLLQSIGGPRPVLPTMMALVIAPSSPSTKPP